MTDSPLQEAGWAFEAGSGAGVGDAVSNLLRSLSSPPRLLGFGEPMHAEDTFLRLRNQAFQHLVEHHGYRSIAIESHSLAGFIADGYVAGAPGAIREVTRTGIAPPFGEQPADRVAIASTR